MENHSDLSKLSEKVIPPRRILCICHGGRVRSVAMRKVLTDDYAIDALACGVQKNSPDTIRLLAQWAELIIVPEITIKAEVERILKTKPPIKTGIVNLCIGPDVWNTASHPDLIDFVKTKLYRLMEVFTHASNPGNRGRHPR